MRLASVTTAISLALSLPILVACERSPQDTANKANAAKACDMAWSETEIAARRASGLISGMDVTSSGLTVEVSETRLSNRPEGTLESIVEAADCAIGGPTGHLAKIDVRSSETGRMIASYSAIELLGMRERTERKRSSITESQEYASFAYASHCVNAIHSGSGRLDAERTALNVPWSILRVGGTDQKPILECSISERDRTRYMTVEVRCADHSQEQCTAFIGVADQRQARSD